MTKQAVDSQQSAVRSTRRRDGDYIIDLCDLVLRQKASRHHRFDFLRGDPGEGGRCAKLPVDAYYEQSKLVVEYHERQHTDSVSIFDERPTCSGCTRGQQRKIYDQRRRDVLPQNGIRLVELSYDFFQHDGKKRLRKNPAADEARIRELFADILLETMSRGKSCYVSDTNIATTVESGLTTANC